MNPYHPHALRDRGRIATIFVFVVLAGLMAVFFRAQVLRTTEFADVGRQNRIRNLDLLAPRGMIYDRDGRLIADNAPGYGIALLPAPSDSIRARLERLREILPVSDARVERVIADATVARFEPVWVIPDATIEQVAAVEERRSAFPDIYIEARPRRRYHGGAALGPLLGQIGEVTRQELDSTYAGDPRYAGGVIVGKTGIEKQYERRLQGTRGNRYVEVDARSRIVGDFVGVEDRTPQPGQDITLNIDLELQEYIHSIFPDSLSGAVVAIDPADGGVLALYSAPSYDPNVFVGGISTQDWEGLRGGEGSPLFNKAVQGTYAPASTFKLATAAMALEMGVVRPDEHMPQACTGSFQFGRVWRCWKRDGHGDLSLLEAIRDSCDVYYYQLGLRVGLQRLLEAGNRLGFSERCGIDLPSEAPGVFPRSEQFWVDTYGYRPTEGETLNLMIGQGANDQTPLKMAQFYTAIARDGSAPAPSILQGRDPNEAEGWTLDLSDEAIDVMREGLRQVTAPGGTAQMSALELWDFIGKTGTGENVRSQAGLAFDDAWFASIAGPWGEDPEIVLVVLVVEGDSGSRVAAPIAAKAADFYLRGKHGIPRTEIQTRLEHIQNGVSAAWANQRRDPEVWRGAHLRARARYEAEAARDSAEARPGGA